MADGEAIDDELAAWSFDLPPDRIATHPPAERDGGRLCVLPRTGGSPSHRAIVDLPDLLRPGDLLVANDTAVLPARLHARRDTGGAVEVLLLSGEEGEVPALLRPARRVKVGEALRVATGRVVVCALPDADGIARVRPEPDVATVLRSGEVPLPPYLGRASEPSDRERYQTVYAGPAGSVAAPTAGLHLTHAVLGRLAARGVGFATVTLHVGIGTFRPLRPEDLARGALHAEPWVVPEATARAIAATRAAGGRVVAVGTTSARVLESAVDDAGVVRAGAGVTTLFLRPGSTWRVVDGLLTNFHLPGSSLLLLVGSLVGLERLLASYQEAVARGYRFYSYGDAMLVLS